MAARVAQEIEAKLLAPRVEQLEHLARMRTLCGRALRPRRRARLSTTYFDTEELSLLSAGACVRVRADGARREATAKWMGRAKDGLHARPELTVELPRARGARGAGTCFELPQGPLRDALSAIVAGRPLVPVLTTHIDRRVVDVVAADEDAPGGARVLFELALDRVTMEDPRAGRAARGADAAEYGEVELELRDGSVAELAALADALRREHGLSPTDETKLGRGLALFHPDAAAEAQAVWHGPIGPNDSVGVALRKALGAQLAALREHEPRTRAGEDPEGLHDQRVAVRRARALLRAFGKALPPRRRAHLKRELRVLGRALGAVRDLDVQIEGCERLAGVLPKDDLAALDARLRELHAERQPRRQALLGTLDGERYHALLIELEQLCRERDEHRHGESAQALAVSVGAERLARELGELAERGQALCARGRKAPDAELHALRIDARRTRYVLEALAPLAGPPGKRVIKRLQRIQDRLGEHQDAVVAAQMIEAHRSRLGGRGHTAARRGLDRLAARERGHAERARQGYAKAHERLLRAHEDVDRMLARLTSLAQRAARGTVE